MDSKLVDNIAGAGDGELDSRLRQCEERRRALAAQEALLLAEIDRRKLYAIDGHATMWGKLRAELSWSNGECRQHMQLARLLDDHADLAELLLVGRLPLAHANEIARAAANPRVGDLIGDVTGFLATESQRLEYDDFRVLVRRWEVITDVDGAHQEFEAGDDARNAHVTVFDGVGHVDAQFGAADAAEAKEIFDRFCDTEFLADWEHTRAELDDDVCKAALPRTDAQRRADALIAIFRAAASAPPGSRRPVPTLNVMMDASTFEEMLIRIGVFPAPLAPAEPSSMLLRDRRCETTTGIAVDPILAVKIAFEGHVRRVVCDSSGAVIDLGRRQRLFRGSAREAVMLHSRRCIHPGCRVRVGNCDADHLTEFGRGGSTCPDNGGPMCRRHNLRKNAGYTTHRDVSGHWSTFRPDGTEIC
ncbi:MAG: DUF222 domain-containing protein [Ilumatobacteraceae bacterium]